MASSKFSLSFNKRIEKRNLQPSAISSERSQQQQQPALQALEAIDENTLKTDECELEEQQLVIPMVEGSRSAILRKAQEEAQKRIEGGGKAAEEKNNDGGKTGRNENDKNGKKTGEDSKNEEVEEKKTLTLEEQAASALLEESQRKLELWEEREKNDNLTIAATSQESSLATAVSDIGKEASLDDYDEIDVSSYGAAMLRGMGWKKTEGIGRIGKRVVEIIDPTTKAFSLARKRQENSKEGEEEHGKQEEEELPLVKGSFVFLHSGRNRGTYGVIEVVDEDHVLVKAAVNHAMIREVELNLRVITQQEYKEFSRVINKDMYDKFKEEEARKKEEQRKGELRKKSKYSDSSDETSKDDKKRERKEYKSGDRYKRTSEQSERNKQESKPYDRSWREREESDKESKQRLNVERTEKSEKHKEDRDTDSKYSRKEGSKTKSEVMGRGEESRKDSDRYFEKHQTISKSEDDDHRKERVKDKWDRKSRRQEREEESSDLRRDGNTHDSQTNEKSRSKKVWEERLFDDREKNKEKYGSQTSGKSKDKKEWNTEKLLDESRGVNKSRERRELKEDRKLTEKERILKKYGSQASIKSQGKREREDEVYNQPSKKLGGAQDWMSAVPWVRENLRVRLINKDYKGGKYYKEKVVVRCVVTAESCECEAEGGRLLKDIHPAWLETVIPKVPPQVIMIVKGDSKGQRGRILQLHKDQEKASIQLLDDETVIMKRHYDDICEYVQG